MELDLVEPSEMRWRIHCDALVPAHLRREKMSDGDGGS